MDSHTASLIVLGAALVACAVLIRYLFSGIAVYFEDETDEDRERRQW